MSERSSSSSRLRVEPSPKRVRAVLAGVTVVDTARALLVWEGPHYPQYYVPAEDVRRDLLVASDRAERSPSRGEARFHGLKVDGREVPDAVWEYPESPIEALRGHLRFEWSALDHWFEEEDEVFVHPRDPYSRVDVLASSRHVEVFVDGEKVADSVRPMLLFETGLPTRYYLPLTDVRLDLLEPSRTTTRCPYKGVASYYSLRLGDTVHEDLVWYYPVALPECARITGLVCFYNERVDLVVDGVAVGRPRRSPFG